MLSNFTQHYKISLFKIDIITKYSNCQNCHRKKCLNSKRENVETHAIVLGLLQYVHTRLEAEPKTTENNFFFFFSSKDFQCQCARRAFTRREILSGPQCCQGLHNHTHTHTRTITHTHIHTITITHTLKQQHSNTHTHTYSHTFYIKLCVLRNTH